MTGLDCNILVQLALADHPANAATVTAVQAEVQSGSRLVFPPLVINEFLHVITDARRFSPPLTMIEALDWVENFLANPAVGVLEPTPESLRQALRWLRQFNLGRKRILAPISPLCCTPQACAGCSRPIPQTSPCSALLKSSHHEINSHQ